MPDVVKGKLTPAQQKELLQMYRKKKQAVAELDEAAAVRLEKKNAVDAITAQIDAVMEEAATGQLRLPLDGGDE